MHRLLAVLATVTLALGTAYAQKSEAELRRENFALRMKVDSLQRLLRSRGSGFSLGEKRDAPVAHASSLADHWGDLSALDSVDIVPFEKIDTILFVPIDGRVDRYMRIYAIERRTNMMGILRRYDRYYDYFCSVFRKYDIPEEFTALSIVESAVNPKARSKAGALGIWQLMEDTAHDYGLRTGGERDERFDIALSTDAAARILRDSYEKYGSWALALMSYNCGPGKVDCAVKECGKEITYEKLNALLPQETADYLPALVAAMYVVTNRTILID